MERDSNLAGFKMPEAHEAAFMKATCKYVSVLDFSQGLGHGEQLIIDERGEAVDLEPRQDKWGAAHGDAR